MLRNSNSQASLYSQSKKIVVIHKQDPLTICESISDCL